VDKVIVKFKGRVIFRQYIPKKRKCFGIKIYKLCDESGCMYDMRVYVGRGSHSSTDDMTATHETVRHLTNRVEGSRHKIFMDSFFSPPRLFDDLDICKINSCGTVRPNRRDMPSDFGPKQLKLKRGDVKLRTRGGLTTLILSSCGAKYTYRDFRLLLVRNLIEEAGKSQDCPPPPPPPPPVGGETREGVKNICL